jgi:hypothetical protein
MFAHNVLYQLNSDMTNDLRRWLDILFEAMTDPVLTVYRGEYSGNKGGRFWTEDREFARQFTQSAQDREIMVRHLYSSDVYKKAAHTYAGDPDAIDAAIAQAREEADSGVPYKAVLLDEGPGQPPSIYVFDRTALMRSKPYR